MRSREEISMIGFEIVAYAGDARSKLIMALNKAKEQKFDECDELIKQAHELLREAHNTQTEMIAEEAGGNYSDLTFVMVHGQDHLMTTMLLKDIIETLIDVYRK